MAKLKQWQKDYIEEITAMSNSELLDEVLAKADGWAEMWGEEWKFKVAETHLRMRLVNWLNEGEK